MEEGINKSRRIWIKYKDFYFSLLWNIIGSFLYFLGKSVSLPGKFLNQNQKVFLFSSSMNIYLQTSFIVGTFFLFYNFIFDRKNQNKEQIEKFRDKFSKFLRSNTFCLIGIISNWNFIKHSPYYIFITYLIYFSSNCLFEIIIDWMNDYGICNGFNLIYFLDQFPFIWIKKNLIFDFQFSSNFFKQPKLINFLFIFFITCFFTWFSNLRWEIPIETSNSYINNHLIEKKFNFCIGMNFNFMNMFRFNYFLKIFYSLFTIISQFKLRNDYHKISDFFGSNFLKFLFLNFKEEHKKIKEIKKAISPNDSVYSLNKFNFLDLFVGMSDDNIYIFKNFFNNLLFLNWKYLNVIFCLLFSHYFINWISIYNDQLNPKEISERLKKRGIYFDGISFGEKTKKLLNISINKILIFWSFFVIIFNILFDEFFNYSNKYSNKLPIKNEIISVLSFFSLINKISVFIEIYKQIKIKYEYVKSYE